MALLHTDVFGSFFSLSVSSANCENVKKKTPQRVQNIYLILKSLKLVSINYPKHKECDEIALNYWQAFYTRTRRSKGMLLPISARTHRHRTSTAFNQETLCPTSSPHASSAAEVAVCPFPQRRQQLNTDHSLTTSTCTSVNSHWYLQRPCFKNDATNGYPQDKLGHILVLIGTERTGSILLSGLVNLVYVKFHISLRVC